MLEGLFAQSNVSASIIATVTSPKEMSDKQSQDVSNEVKKERSVNKECY